MKNTATLETNAHVEAPSYLQDQKAWLVWKFEPNDGGGKPRKIPHYVGGGRRWGTQGTPRDMSKLATYDEAVAELSTGKYEGLGFAPLPEFGICALDFDNCLVDGEPHPDLTPIITGTYAELSPSGNGVRAFVRGNYGDRKDLGQPYGVELFSEKGFVTVTGNVLDIVKILDNADTVAELDAEVRALCAKRFKREPGTASAGTGERVGMTEDEVRDILAKIPNELDYDDWVRSGMAVHHETGGEGFDIWDEWSQTNLDKYTTREYGWERWVSFGKNDNVFGMHGLRKMAGLSSTLPASVDDFEVNVLTDEEQAEGEAARQRNKNRPPPIVLETERQRSQRIAREGTHLGAPTQRVMSGTEMLEECVFVSDGSRVAFLKQPRAVLPFNEFKQLTAGSQEVKKKTAEARASKVHRAALWLESPDRKTVRTMTFAPGRAPICESPDGDTALNLWVPRSAKAPSNWQNLWKVFYDHVEYLVPNASERERFLDWLAHIEQVPGELPHTHYLLVAKQTGIGRNWLAYALARVWAGYVALGFDLGESLRSGFNGALSQRLLAVVDELHEGGPGGASKPVAEKLKSMLTEATRRVNPKYGRQHVEFNACRFLMFSNHEAALPLAENDRRVVVLENPSQRRPEAYYKELYDLLHNPDLGAAIAEGLSRRDISNFNAGSVAPMSAAKSRTIRAGRSEIEQAVRDLAQEWPSDCITSGRLHSAVSVALGTNVGSTQAACVLAGIVKRDGRVRVAGVPSHVWIVRDHGKWASAPAAEVAAEVLRGSTVVDAEAIGHLGEEFA